MKQLIPELPTLNNDSDYKTDIEFYYLLFDVNKENTPNNVSSVGVGWSILLL